jgi:uncharacterized membrane protein
MRRVGNDDGSTLLLTIFYATLSVVLILLVVAATSLYLERKRLFTVADGASLVGAESFALDDVKATSAGMRPTLTSPDVAGAVSDYLATSPTGPFTRLRVDRAVSTDGRSATVELSCDWAPPIVTLFIPRGLRIRVTLIARSVFS